MTAEEARKRIEEHFEEETFQCNMESIYFTIDRDIEEAVEKLQHSCVSNIGGCDKPWEQIYKERELIEKHYNALGYDVECLGYTKCCMWDSYKISW